MNKVIVVLLALCLFCSCRDMAPTHASIIMASQDMKEIPKGTVDTLTIDTKASEIWWKGTKMFGVKSHSGIIQIKSGFIEVKDEKLLGGSFYVDMNTIEVTDIPAHDPIPKRGLENHLKDRDFFDVKRHPEAHLRITSVKPFTEQNLEFTGQLTIRGITNDVQFTGEF
uniref:YceI family protein n=1 Tax=uncultured Muriicola sp. TaxID=1583102 RepID=UPI002639F92D